MVVYRTRHRPLWLIIMYIFGHRDGVGEFLIINDGNTDSREMTPGSDLVYNSLVNGLLEDEILKG